MFLLRYSLLRAGSLLAVFCCVSALTTRAATVTYNPALNTLPEAQGFTFTQVANGDPLPPAPTVSGGILSQGPTDGLGLQYWQRSDVPFNFDNGFTIEVNLKVITSYYDAAGGGDGFQRFGWNMEAVDALGRRFTLGIDSTGFALNTDNSQAINNGIPHINFNTTNAFHDYRLVVSGGIGTLFVDNVVQGSTPVGAAVRPDEANLADFSDWTSSAYSQTQLSLFQYSDSVLEVPEPGTAGAATMALLVLLGKQVRRRWAAAHR